jgi:hypothetical protein
MAANAQAHATKSPSTAMYHRPQPIVRASSSQSLLAPPGMNGNGQRMVPLIPVPAPSSGRNTPEVSVRVPTSPGQETAPTILGLPLKYVS